MKERRANDIKTISLLDKFASSNKELNNEINKEYISDLINKLYGEKKEKMDIKGIFLFHLMYILMGDSNILREKFENLLPKKNDDINDIMVQNLEKNIEKIINQNQNYSKNEIIFLIIIIYYSFRKTWNNKKTFDDEEIIQNDLFKEFDKKKEQKFEELVTKLSKNILIQAKKFIKSFEYIKDKKFSKIRDKKKLILFIKEVGEKNMSYVSKLSEDEIMLAIKELNKKFNKHQNSLIDHMDNSVPSINYDKAFDNMYKNKIITNSGANDEVSTSTS